MEDNELESGQVRQVVAPRSIALDLFLSAEILVATEAARLICWRLRKLLCKYTVEHISETLLLSIYIFSIWDIIDHFSVFYVEERCFDRKSTKLLQYGKGVHIHLDALFDTVLILRLIPRFVIDHDVLSIDGSLHAVDESLHYPAV